MLQSIESSYQETGLVGRDKEKAYCYILYSPTIITDGDGSVTVDKSLMLSFYHNSFWGIKKENRIMLGIAK